jgi:hypothetical protein
MPASVSVQTPVSMHVSVSVYVSAVGAYVGPLETWLGPESLAHDHIFYPTACQPRRLHQTSIYETFSVPNSGPQIMIVAEVVVDRGIGGVAVVVVVVVLDRRSGRRRRRRAS